MTPETAPVRGAQYSSLGIFASLLLLFSLTNSATANADVQVQLTPLFKSYDSCFVLLDRDCGKRYYLNEEKAKVRLSPCSTFKIFNSLVGLETGVLNGPNHEMKWDGKRHSIESWNGDQTLRSAVSNSVVWYFQRVAQGIGETRMQHYIDEVGYGNRDISGGITKFWLGDSLKISADEQVSFLNKLIDRQLPFKESTMETVQDVIKLKTSDKGVLYGKTGSDMKDGKKILGWFVGFVQQPKSKEKPEKFYVFATNIQADDGAWGPKARELCESALTELGIF